jgi:hypothetical protein
MVDVKIDVNDIEMKYIKVYQGMINQEKKFKRFLDEVGREC